MSECVVRMKMPERCYECEMADGVTCMATGGVYGREVPKMTWIRRRPDWCPIICQLPEGHGRLVDADAKYLSVVLYGNGLYANYNTSISETLGKDIMRNVKVIVPADAERSE